MEGQVTFLTDLPELDALEHQHIQNHPQGNQHIQQGYQKFIRNNGGRPGSDGTYRTMSGMKPRMQENFQCILRTRKADPSPVAMSIFTWLSALFVEPITIETTRRFTLFSCR